MFLHRPCLILAFSLLTALAAVDADNVVLRWNEAHLEAIRTTRPGPPQVARGLAIVSTCAYDAWAAYDVRARSTVSPRDLRQHPSLRNLPALRHEALSYAAYRALLDLFPSEQARFDLLMAEFGYDPAVMTLDPDRPAGVGNRVAALVLELRHRDGSNQLGDLSASGIPYADWTGYQPSNPPMLVAQALSLDAVTPGLWQPLTYPVGGNLVTPTFLTPHWGRVAPFALRDGAQFRPVPPPAWDSPEHLAEVEEVLHISATLGDYEKAVAEFWADGPATELPPGHWNVLAQFVSRRDGHGMDEDVRMFFALNNALHDAAVAAWDCKRHYDYWRPITAIRYLKHGQSVLAWSGPGAGAASIPGEAWVPYQQESFPTPPFSEYVSGHSTFSAAAAEVLMRFTGSDSFGASHIVPAGWSKVEANVPAQDVTLYWQTFSEAADEAGMSRLYGGIHFRSGDLAGRSLGRRIGTRCYLRAQALWGGNRSHGPWGPKADG